MKKFKNSRLSTDFRKLQTLALKIHCFCLGVWVGEYLCHVSYRKGDHYFPDVIMALQFYPVAYQFLRGKRESSRIYGYAYG